MYSNKKLIITALVAGLSLMGLQQASAKGWGRGGYGGDCSCQCYGAGHQQLDDATRGKVDAFRSETTALRKQIVMKRAELRALMSSQTPDATAVAQVAGELFDLKTEMAEKAKTAGVPFMGGQQGRMDSDYAAKGKGRSQPPCLYQQDQQDHQDPQGRE